MNSQFSTNAAHKTNKTEPVFSSSKYEEWQPHKAKQQMNETINSNQSVDSVSVPREDYEEPEHEVQILKMSQGQKAFTEATPVQMNHKIDPNQSQLDGTLLEINQAMNDPVPQQLVQPFKSNQSNNKYLSVPQSNQYDQISGLSQTRPPQRKQESYLFFYDRTGDLQSRIVTVELSQNLIRHIITKTIFPLGIVFFTLLILNFIQRRLKDFCYIDNLTKCEDFSIKIWSFVRQMIVFKLAMIFYRQMIIKKISIGNSQQKSKHPVMELFVLTILTVVIDFVFVIWINQNQDWAYLIIIYTVTVAVMLSTYKTRDWVKAFYRGNAIIFYDIMYVLILCYLFYVIPTIIDQFRESAGDIVVGNTQFMYLYPVLDFTAEYLFDWALSHLSWGELYIYQANLMFIGLRIGVLLLRPWDTFEFWYLMIVLTVIRIDNASLFLTVFIRRMIYYGSPKFAQRFTAMQETAHSVKGKHGANLEHLVWLIFFFMFYIGGFAIPYYAGSQNIISDATFETSYYDQIPHSYQAIIIWGGMLIGDFLGVQFNRMWKHDNIKWFANTEFSFVENTLTRMIGYYFFSMAVLIPRMTAQLSLLDRNQQFNRK